MNPVPDAAELLRYLADIGWSDLYLPEAYRARISAAAGAEASRPGAAASRPAASNSSVSPPPGDFRAGASPDEVRPPSEGSLQAPRRTSGAPSPSPRRPEAEIRAELDALEVQVSGCRECKLCTTRTRTVFASGDPRARLMLIGEGPGAEEDRQGLPFVGAAGELLNRILGAIGSTREEVYVANIVKCRPPGNRDPEPDEVRACRGYLERQIDLVRPAVIVALGRVAAHELLGNDFSLTRLRGEWHQVRGIPVRVTYHPAALLRNAAYKRPTWEDMQLVRDHLRSLPAAADFEGASVAGDAPGASGETGEGD